MKKLNILTLKRIFSIILSFVISFSFLQITFADETDDPSETVIEPSDDEQDSSGDITPLLDISLTDNYGVKLSFECENPEATYAIYKSASTADSFSEIYTASGLADHESYIDEAVIGGRIYYYRLDAVVNDTVYSSDVSNIKVPLQSPGNLKATIKSSSKVKLEWDEVTGANKYIIFRSNKKKSGFKKIGTSSKTTYTDKTTTSGKAYYYKIRAKYTKNSWASSGFSKIKAVYQKPDTPTVYASSSRDVVNLSWNKVSGAKMYYIYRKGADASKYKLIKKTKKISYTDKKVTDGKKYNYKIKAVYKKDGKVIKSKASAAVSVTVTYIDPDGKMIALTFDDGPGKYTQAIVNCLKKYNAHATFFVVGQNVNSYKSALKSAYDAGCEIGNHSYSHPKLTSLSSSGVSSQIKNTDSKVKNITGEKTSIMRPPYGAYDSTVKSIVGKPLILWSIDTLDWKTRSTSSTVSCVMSKKYDGAIVLMHDIHQPTKNAALQIIPKLIDQGYQLVTVSELAKYKGYTMKNGHVYNSFK